MRAVLVRWALTCLCCLGASMALASSPGDRPGSGEITIDDTPYAVGLSTDRSTYFPGTVATLLGTGFLAGEAVSIQVLPLGVNEAAGVDHRPWRIAADATGAFTTGWPVCPADCVGKVVRAVAIGEISGRNAEVRFTDHAVGAGPPSPPVPSPPGDKPGSGEITTDDPPGVSAAVSADQTTYFPGNVATLLGTGFLAGEAVSVQVLPLGVNEAAGVDHRPWRIAADATGAFTTRWPVCTGDCVGKVLRAVAVGEISGRNAEVRFTDHAVGAGPPSPPVPSPPGDKPGSGEITTDDPPGVVAALRADQSIYFPGTVATFLGSGFLSGEAVSVQVVHRDGSQVQGQDHWPWRIAAGQDGAFITTWRVCTDDCVGLVVNAIAVGEISGRQAEVQFTDQSASLDPVALPTTNLDVAAFSLRQNAPNPFGERTRIIFALPEVSTVKVRVFDALGHHVATLADGTMGPGLHGVEWNGQGHATGVYFCRMDATGASGSFHQLRRMTLIR